MKRIIFLIAIYFFSLKINAQPTLKQWDKTYGGTDADFFSKILFLNGNYYMCGDSRSNADGDKSQANKGLGLTEDYWVVKTDAQGNKIWDKSYGGNGWDILWGATESSDKQGFVLAGNSASSAGIDKSQNGVGQVDYWIVKIDTNGNKIWDKTFGGYSSDYIYKGIISTYDKGYLLGGNSNSGIGGDKSEDVRGNNALYYDFWVVKVDSNGNKQWDKTFGGFNDDGITSIAQCSDKGYLLGGSSKSEADGDKSVPRLGYSDIWLVKIDSLGNKIWDKAYGADPYSYDLVQILNIDNNRYLLLYYGGGLMMIDDTGGIIKEKGFNLCLDTYNSISKTRDGGFLVSGTALNVCTDPGIDQSEIFLNNYQTWIAKTDSLLNKQWDKTIFSAGLDEKGQAIQVADHCYAIAAQSNSESKGGYKSENTRGASDYWIVKLCEDPNGIEMIASEDSVIVYPNPFEHEIAIKLQKEIKQATYVLSTLEGKILYQQEEVDIQKDYVKIWDLAILPKGVYYITVIADGEKIVKKVLKV